MEELYLGVAREIITPPIGGNLYGYQPDIFSESVADDLTATAFYFRQGDKVALMISVTVCLVQTALADRILSDIEQKFGVPKRSCMLCATHTHSGPNTAGVFGWGDIDAEYCDNILIPGIMQAVRLALEKPEPVKVGIAEGESCVGVNRRELMLDNSVGLGQNEWGCFDPRMTVISFRNAEEKTVANIIHYGAHGTAAGINHEISRDWSGIMVDTLEGATGGITAFFNGPEGDVGPRMTNGRTIGNMRYVNEVGFVAAQDAVRIHKKIKGYRRVSLGVTTEKVKVPLKKRMDLPSAMEQYKRYKEKAVNVEASIRKHCEDVIASYANGYEDKEAMEINQPIITIGEAAFVGSPYELFSEIGLRIRRAVKKYSVLSLSNTNGSEGYFVTQDQICRGGYEIDMFLYGHVQPYCDNADWHLVKETVKNLNKIN